MNRTLTAAVALAAGLGMTGLAHAQGSSSNPQTMPSSPSMSQPGTTSPSTGASTQSPGAMQNPSTSSGSGYGTESPQASSQTNQSQGGMQVSQSQIQQAQQQLKAQGLYRGEVDGINGPQTARAVSQFQKAQGLPQTAQLDQQTMDRLMSASGGNSDSGAQNTGTTPRMAPGGTQSPSATPPAGH